MNASPFFCQVSVHEVSHMAPRHQVPCFYSNGPIDNIMALFSFLVLLPYDSLLVPWFIVTNKLFMYHPLSQAYFQRNIG